MYDTRLTNLIKVVEKLQRRVELGEELQDISTARIESLERAVLNLLALVKVQAELGHKTVEVLRSKFP